MKINCSVVLSILVVCVNTSSTEEFSRGNNILSLQLYSEIIKENKGNVLVSPFSIEVILALSQSGAKNQTAEEIRTSLHLPNKDDDVRAIFKSVLPTLLKSDKNFSLHTANKIYIKDTFTLKNEVKKLQMKFDFSKKVQAAKTMNKWVEEETENKIQNLIDPDILSDVTTLIAINALHFKGQWYTGFNPEFTKKANFSRIPDDVIQIDMMSDPKMGAGYYEDAELGAKFLELYFLDDDISMVCILPDKKDGIGALENQIQKVLTIRNFSYEQVAIELPKFNIQNAVNLKKKLTNLGVEKAFSESEADFSGIINEEKNIFINEVIQKSFIDVNENGVEANECFLKFGV